MFSVFKTLFFHPKINSALQVMMASLLFVGLAAFIGIGAAQMS